MPFSDLVFVYGTLRRGEYNHRYLSGARRRGVYRTSPGYTLLDLGDYPAVISGGRTAIVGEVYAINDALLNRLDRLEGYPHEYTRERISTPYGPAWIYLYRHHPAHSPVIPGGDWRRRSKSSTGPPPPAAPRP